MLTREIQSAGEGHRQVRYLGTTALAALVLIGTCQERAHAQTSASDVKPNLPPVTVQPDERPAARQQSSSTTGRAAKRRSSRDSRTAARPVPATAADAGAGTKPRDGIDGYVTRATGVGTKGSTPILQLPRSVSTVTAQEIADRDAQSTRDALQYTAGVNTYFREGQFTRDYVYIRGFQGFQFLDGQRLISTSNYGIEPYGLERIDVLKGPAASIYGQGSPGGLWDLTSKRPTDQAFGEAVLRASTREGTLGAIDVGGPVTADHSLLYRFVGLGKFGDGLINYSKTDRAYVAPSFTWRPNEDTSLTVLASYQYDPNLTVLQPLPFKGSIVPGPTGQFIPRNVFQGEPSYHDTSVEQTRIGYEFNHRFNDIFSFQQKASYQNTDIKLKELQSLTSPNTTTTSRYMNNQVFKIETYQIDNKISADFDTGPFRHHVMFGIDYSAVPNYQGTGQNIASPYTLNLYNPVYGQPLAAANPITTNRYQDQRQLGYYVQDRVEIGRLSVLLGGRRDELLQTQRTPVLNLTTGVLSNPPLTRQQDQAETYNAGVIYNFSNGIAPFASYSQTFVPTVGTDFFGKSFVPVTGDQKEIGIKYLPPGLDLLITASVFDIVQYNVLTPDLDPLHRRFSVQTSSQQNKGAEFEFKTTRLYGFNVSASYSYIDAKVIATNTAGALGKHPVAIPLNQASLWATYRFASSRLAGLTLGGGVRYIGDSAGDPLNTFAVPSFTLFDMMASYELGTVAQSFEKWDVALNVKNIADKRYVGSCDDAQDCYYGPGRTVSGTLRARF